MAGRILVTGATGFVGTALTTALTAKGHDVLAVGRRETGDLGPKTDWRPWLEPGTDCVIHLAGRAHVMRDEAADPAAAYDAVNRAATALLAEQAAAAGIRRIVYMSSVKALAESGLDVTPQDSPTPLDDYGRSKLAAERALLEAAPGSEIRGRRLPVWKVDFSEPESLSVYVDPHTGEIVARRTTRWRVFDFLWMLHIMDFDERDDFNTPLLQVAAVLGLLIALSGLVYWAMTTRLFRRKRPA